MEKPFYDKLSFRIMAPLVYGDMVYVLILLIFDTITELNENFFGQELLLCMLITAAIFEAWRLCILLLERFLPLQERLVIRLPVQLLVLGTSGVAICFSLLYTYFSHWVGYSSIENFSAELFSFSAIFLASSFLYNMVFFSLVYLKKENESQLRHENMLREMLLDELEALSYQVNQHFLYTSLEALISLVHADPEEADLFVDKLSGYYRYMLSQQKREPGTLAQEVAAAHNLVALLNYQQGQAIVLKANLEDKDLQYLVVPGTLVSLIGCIVQTTILSPLQPLELRLTLEEDQHYWVLEHRLNDKLLPGDGQRDCLEKIEKAYKIYADMPPVQLRAYGQRIVKIPLLRLVQDENQ